MFCNLDLFMVLSEIQQQEIFLLLHSFRFRTDPTGVNSLFLFTEFQNSYLVLQGILNRDVK